MKLFQRLGVAAAAALAIGLGGGPSAEAAPNLDKRVGVIFDHVMLEGDPRELIPCIRVLRRYLNQARHDENLSVELRIQYLSNGTVIEKYFVTKLRDMRLTDHHAQPGGEWRLVETTVDVSDAVPDGDSDFSGEATLVEGNVAVQSFPLTFGR